MRQAVRTAVVILAGGEGRRMGGGKPLRLLAGQTLLDHALELARSWSDTIAVAVHEKGQVGEIDVPQLVDREGSGPIAGIASALALAEAHDFDAVLTLPTDTPLLPADLLERLRDATFPVAIPVSGGRLHPASSLWRREVRPHLPGYLATGRGSLLGLAERAGYATIEWSAEPFDPFLNVNDETDLAAAAALLRNR